MSGDEQRSSGEQTAVSLVREKNHFPASPSRAEEEAVYWDWRMAKGQSPSWAQRGGKTSGGREGSQTKGREPRAGETGASEVEKA